MPSSFSRFLDESQLQEVRDLYLESLAALDDDLDDLDGDLEGSQAPSGPAPSPADQA